jgi:hypothetical protein
MCPVDRQIQNNACTLVPRKTWQLQVYKKRSRRGSRPPGRFKAACVYLFEGQEKEGAEMEKRGSEHLEHDELGGQAGGPKFKWSQILTEQAGNSWLRAG